MQGFYIGMILPYSLLRISKFEESGVVLGMLRHAGGGG